jgi:small subunit ribosomal protein S9
MTETTRKPLTGRRKESVARVRLVPGPGKHIVNDRTPIEYLKRESLVQAAFHALVVTNAAAKFSVIARALVKDDESLRGTLGREGLLTRDSRMKERKKYGQPGARKRFQFSKR